MAWARECAFGLMVLAATLGTFAAARADTLVASDRRPHAEQAQTNEVDGVSPLRIETERGPVLFTVELARTRQQHARGLQGRTILPAASGMLFDFGTPRPVAMWMKDTHIPLDMFFIGSEGRVVAIERNTTPLSLETISPPEPVRAVLELNAGSAERFGIRVGDRIDHAIFTAQ